MATDDTKRLVGVITDRDICMATFIRGRAPATIAVSEVMARDVASVLASAGIDEALGIMAQRQVRRLPVLGDEEQPVGVITLNDLMNDAARRPASHAHLTRLIDALAAIGRHRDSSAPTRLEVTNDSEAA